MSAALVWRFPRPRSMPRRCGVPPASRPSTAGNGGLPLRRWAGGITAGDRFLLAHCEGPTIDLGCGPGRLTAELARRGVRTLGVDLSGEAVEAAAARSAPVLRADLFGPLPGEGHWRTALLADGNVGIGGAPAACSVGCAAWSRPADGWSSTVRRRAPVCACGSCTCAPVG